jgi:hypothetical protein
MREAKITQISQGTNRLQRQIIGRDLDSNRDLASDRLEGEFCSNGRFLAQPAITKHGRSLTGRLMSEVHSAASPFSRDKPVKSTIKEETR